MVDSRTMRPRGKTSGPAPPLLIGLYSPRPSQGKTTTALALADILKASRGTETRFRPFEEPLKIVAFAVLEHGLGLSEVEVTRALYRNKDQPVPGHNFTGRHLLGTLKAYISRPTLGEDVWISRTTDLAAADLAEGRNVIVDDVGQVNEYEALEALEALMVRITRAGAPEHNPAGPLDHLGFHLHLQNDHGLPALKAKLRMWVKGLSASQELLRSSPSSPTVTRVADDPGPPAPNVSLTVSEVASAITRTLADRPWTPHAAKVLNDTMHRVAAEALAEALLREEVVISRPPSPKPRPAPPTWPQESEGEP